MTAKNTFKSAVSGGKFADAEKVYAKDIRQPILKLIQQDCPGFKGNECLAMSELGSYREKYIADFLNSDVTQLSELQKNVISSFKGEKSFVNKVEDGPDKRDFGQRLADSVADFGGSWTFIISFMVFILIWIGANVFILMNKGFDPYPFILLNLILSCLAALQAPIIMMSQNRQEEKDRERAKKDYMINLKSELEIRLLDEKLDHLLLHQQQELIEVQKIQIELMKDILEQVNSNKL